LFNFLENGKVCGENVWYTVYVLFLTTTFGSSISRSDKQEASYSHDAYRNKRVCRFV